LKKHNLLAIISVLLIIFALVSGLKVSNSLIFGDYLLKIAGLPTMTNGDSGFNISGLMIIASFILGIVLFRLYFRKYRTRWGELFLFGLIAFIFFYQPIYNHASIFIKSQHSGLKAIEYNKVNSLFTYNISPTKDYVECHCSLKFINYSHKAQEFQIEQKQLEEQIKANLQKYYSFKIFKLENDDEKHLMFLPPPCVRIGYYVCQKERNKGYAKIILAKALEICREFGIDKVLLTCAKSNIASVKTIIANGGILEKEVEDNGEILQRYWINI